ncbi:aminoacyltransferase [Staphylococcus kloosii]|jgi:peptidoglycan pentaglycine glycine transferase (the fourth and fifth glycine)|uniref:Aminoacyltransferase n=1 Tax=Staphylococcus kloosii TaxID=29384 RepID=A0A151A5E8_9STAP|nr:aminoacyltransferase [Staphylococcus kloosii]AVQ36255.1 aminoacyltransferase [Staphylococcus kloosii]KYH14557.1 aminoacyltransferase [Staphylococcus kloosii]MBF7022151.1 aminoacyltransferase [Staphylococcus kloosii]MBF7029263.1 aminoacyltransferase [Staphylococcus kloosii]MCD8878573.1 aminoacyltransferase [Staphylococcus kloosii]
MKFTELTVKEYDNFVQNPSLESHYFQVKESIATREEDGFQVVLLGLKDDNNQVIAASLFSKIPTMGSYVYYSNRGPVMDYSDLGLVDYYLRELDNYLQHHNCLYVKMDPYWIYQIYDKDINPLSKQINNDALVNLFKAHGYEHHGFTTEYDTSSQVRWMGVLNLDGETPASLKKQFDSQRKRNINKAINNGIKVRFLERDEFHIFLELYRETEERAGFVSKTDDYFYNFIDNYGDKVLVPLAYIDLDENINSIQAALTEKENRRDQMMEKEQKSDKQLKKIAELDRQIEHDKKELLQNSELRQTDGAILNLASGVFFANAYEVNYFSGGSSEKYNRFMGPYMMHWFMINYCFDHGYDRYNFYGLSGDFTENSEDYGVYRFKRGFNVQIEELIGDFYKPIKKTKYKLFNTLNNVRKKLKR